jgi:hypothetical protein
MPTCSSCGNVLFTGTCLTCRRLAALPLATVASLRGWTSPE